MINQDARTDLYGEGKGLAQIVDLNTDQWRANERAADMTRRKKAEKGQADIDKGIAGAESGSKAIFARDREHFNDLQQDLKKYVIDNHDKLAKHDPKAYMDFQDKLGRISREAELSKNLREQVEQIDKDKSLDTMRPEAQDYYQKLKFDKPDYSNWEGAYQLDQSKMKKNVDTAKYVKDVVEPLAKKKLTESKYVSPTGAEYASTKKEYTREEADNLLDSTLLADPHNYEQEHYNLTKEPQNIQDKYATENRDGSKTLDVHRYAHDKWAPTLMAGGENKVESKSSQKDKTYHYNSGNGSWENDKYRWTLEDRENSGAPARQLNIMGLSVELPELKGEKTKEINFASTSEGENKPLVIDMPDGSKKQVIPLSYRTDNDGKDWQFVGVAVDDKGKPAVDAKGNAQPVIIPAQYAKGKVQAEYGFNLDKAAKEAKLGVIEGTGGSTTHKASTSSVGGNKALLGKAKTVKQNGVTYTLQPDGSYK